MHKTIMLTGSTDGIGLETAKQLYAQGHTLLLHGRSEQKLSALQETLSQQGDGGVVETYCADLSQLAEVTALADAITAKHRSLDVLINNAGVFKLPGPTSAAGYDIRFVVNTFAPYLLTKRLLPLMSEQGRVVNLSSAAQAPVSISALRGQQPLSDSEAYAQSKLAITMWSAHLAHQLGSQGPVVVAVNPASFLGSKMVKEAYGSDGKDLSIGADILVRAAISDEFADASGRYFDNDSGQFAPPHPDALDRNKNAALVAAIEEVLA